MKTRLALTFAALTLFACEDKKAPEASPSAEPASASADNAEASPDGDAPKDPKVDVKAEAKTGGEAPSAPQTPPTTKEPAADPDAWPETFGGPDPFDAASGELEVDEGEMEVGKIVSGMKRMSAKDTLAVLDQLKPRLDELVARQAKNDDSVYPMLGYDALTSPSSYTTRAYPMGGDAVFVFAREVDKEGNFDFEGQVPKAAMIYDKKNDVIAYHIGPHDWKRWDSFDQYDFGGVPIMAVGYSARGGQCAEGGETQFYAALPGGVKKVHEEGWDLTTHASETRIKVNAANKTVTFFAQPAIKKNKKRATFVTNKTQETCRLSNGKFSCVTKVLEKNLTTPGCF